MKRQARLAMVLSASVLLTLATAATSLAATKGWIEEDGVWQYLDSSGDPVTESWRKSGTQYFWLDENGEMAVDMLIEDDDKVYYVDENGARVVNDWRKIENDEDWMNGDNEEKTEFIWYFFGPTGKAVTGKKTINGKTHIFDDDGKMYSGWTTYNDKTYYLGEENEGWAYTGWQYLQLGDEIADEYDDDDMWFNFKDSGEMRKAKEEDETAKRVYINGSYFGFDANGVMVDGWLPQYNATATNSVYYMEDTGEQLTGWAYIEANVEDDSSGGDDDDNGGDDWYYLNGKGRPFNVGGYYTDDFSKKSTGVVQVHKNGSTGKKTSQVAAKVIGKKTYLFDNTGAMMTGVYEVKTTVNRVGGAGDLAEGIYYFSKTKGSSLGQMETGKVTVKNKDQKYNYYFASTGRAYTNMIVDNGLYKANGVLVEPEEEEDKLIYEITSDDFTDTITCYKNSSITLEEGDRVIVAKSAG